MLRAIPALDLRIRDGRHDVHPRHVHENVQPAQRLHHCLDGGIDGLLRGHVALDKAGRASTAPDRGDHSPARRHIAVHDADLAALGSEEQGGRTPDPVAGARDLIRKRGRGHRDAQLESDGQRHTCQDNRQPVNAYHYHGDFPMQTVSALNRGRWRGRRRGLQHEIAQAPIHIALSVAAAGI